MELKFPNCSKPRTLAVTFEDTSFPNKHQMQAPRPFDQYRQIFRTQNAESKELLKFVFEKSDSISLWIIGLSISGISVFANNIANIQKVLPPSCLKPILLLLAVSVTAGIIYRALFLYFFVVLNNTQRGIDIAFSNELSMDTESLLNGNETFEELIKVVKDNSGDLSYLLNVYNTIDENAKVILYKSVVDHYLKSVEFAKEDTTLVVDFIADTYSKFTGVSKEKYLKKINSHNAGQQYKWTLRLTTVFYLTYILTFVAALFLFIYAA